MRTKATFRLFGNSDDLTAARVTATLGIEPSRSFEAGVPLSAGSKPSDRSGWLLSSSDSIQDAVELGVQLERLLLLLEPVEAQLWELVGSGYRPNWLCYVGSDAAEHAVEFERELMIRLTRLPGDLWIDVVGTR